LSGNKANTALAKLKKAGCKEVMSLEGGISAWNQAGMPLIKQK
jgi:rhodanese-related sulfurtransferase